MADSLSKKVRKSRKILFTKFDTRMEIRTKRLQNACQVRYCFRQSYYSSGPSGWMFLNNESRIPFYPAMAHVMRLNSVIPSQNNKQNLNLLMKRKVQVKFNPTFFFHI